MALEQNTREAQDRAQGVGDTNRRPDDATEHGGTRTERLAEQARARAAELRECGLEEFSEAREEIRKDARQIALEGREGARRIAEQQKSRLAAHMHRIGDSLRQASGSLEPEEFTPVRRYSQMAAERIDSLADYVERHDADELAEDVAGFARRNPELFLGGAFLAGIAIGRFLRAGSQRDASASMSGRRVRGDDIEDLARSSGGVSGNPFRAGDVGDTGPYRRSPMSSDYAEHEIANPGARDMGRPVGDARPEPEDMGPYGRTTAGGYESTPAGSDARRAGDLRAQAGSTGDAGFAAGSSGAASELESKPDAAPSDTGRKEGM